MIFQGTILVQSQLSNPFVGGIFHPVVVGLAVMATVVPILFVVMIEIGILGSFAVPMIHGHTENTIAGAGGITGLALAVVISLANRTAPHTWMNEVVYAGGGTSPLALSLIALPLGLAFYYFGHPAKSLSSGPHVDEDPPDPEFVRKQRTKWAEGADRTKAPSPTPDFQIDGQSNVESAETCTTGGRNQDIVNLDQLEYHWITETAVSFDDVGGMAELKKELEVDIIKPLTSGRERAKRLDIPIPNILLHGPPGTGKTYIVKALATELGLPFVKLSGSDVQSKWINESPQKIATLFNEAKRVAGNEGGAIVFLDELDSVLKSRTGSESSHEEDNKVTNEFLNHLQETKNHDIVFVGATNRVDALDEAGIRAGRIDKMVYVGKPDLEARVEILQAQLEGRPNNLADEHIEYVARATEGMVAADLESIVIDAARVAAYRREDDTIEWRDFQQSISD